MTSVGITGTRQGMTPKQMSFVRTMLEALQPDEFHHGDCIGVDEEAARICAVSSPDTSIYIHPPTDSKYRARMSVRVGKDHRLQSKDYLKRNADIIRASEYMMACPATRVEMKRGSGTWAAIRECGRQGVPLAIIYPDGTVEHRQ